MVDNLVLFNRHAVKEDFLCEKTGRENAPRRLDSLMITKTASRRRGLVKTPLPRPGELKFVFCSVADLERADAALLDEAAELGDGDLCGNQPVSVTSLAWRSTRLYRRRDEKIISALRFAHSSLSSPPRLCISTSEFAAPLRRCRRKTQPYLEKRGRFWENAATWILFDAAEV